MGPWIALAALVGAGVYLSVTSEGGPEHLGCKGPIDRALALQLAHKWGPMFGCPELTLMTIGKIESGWRATCVNLNARATLRGGAWGMFQQTWLTAQGHAKALKTDTRPEVQATLRKWSGEPTALLDADLNCMFAARQLGLLTKHFGDDLKLVAGAYHQGQGKIDQVLAEGKNVPDDLPPKGKIYVSRALAAHEELV